MRCGQCYSEGLERDVNNELQVPLLCTLFCIPACEQAIPRGILNLFRLSEQPVLLSNRSSAYAHTGIFACVDSSARSF